MVTNNSCNYSPTQYLVQIGDAGGKLADVSAGTTGQFLGANTLAAPTWQTPPGAGGATNSGFYGDGSDGSVTFDGAAVILGLTPSSSIYTLARDLYLASSTINNGVQLKTNGFRIFCNGTLTNNGTIQWDGNPGVAAVQGAAINNTGSSFSEGTGAQSPGTAGGPAGDSGNPNGNPGTNATTVNSFGGAGGSGGNGGAGAGQGSGAAGGTTVAVAASKGSIRSLPQLVLGMQVGGNQTMYAIGGGTGGGAGGGYVVFLQGDFGGGGGGGGGIVIVSASVIDGTGSITANGGAGGNGTPFPVFGTDQGGGGGGGGGGGVVIVISTSASGGAVAGQTITANGGAAGIHNTNGFDGIAGANGTKIVVAA